MKNQTLKSMAKLAKKRLIHKDENFILETTNQPDDQALIEKILSILKTHPDTPVPIKELIDYKKFNTYTPLQKEIYIFDLIEKYNSYKTWYKKYEEQTMVI